MKKNRLYWVGLLIVLMLFMSIMAQSCSDNTVAETQTIETQNQVTTTSMSSVPIPLVTYFQERKTIAK
ncbi:MAG: hypothetical protein JXK93_10065 [Sphaerochaetaceae bacterium]|nr:hypothetical protein [Sphaerochaetaceae bacterium]